MKNKIIILYFILLFNVNKVFAGANLECSSLKWCDDNPYNSDGPVYIISEFISQIILYTAVVAVLALMASWILYMLSMWEEEKTKKAKKWIIWSLVWVAVSVSAWFIINSLNNLSI